MEKIEYKKLIGAILLKGVDVEQHLPELNHKINQLLFFRGDIKNKVERAIKVEKQIISVAYHATVREHDMFALLQNHFNDALEPGIIDIDSELLPKQNFINNSQSGGANRDEVGIDSRVEKMVKSLNMIRGIKTFSSCDGHYSSPFYVLWIHTDNNLSTLNSVLKELTISANEVVQKYFKQQEINFSLLCGYDSWTNHHRKGYFNTYSDLPYFELRISMNGMLRNYPEKFYQFTDDLSELFYNKVKKWKYD